MTRLTEGGRIDRSRPITFTFDGTRYTGFRGDTLASALLANDVRLVGRSFKYHRPRGLVTAGSAEPNGLSTIDGRPNLKMTQVMLRDGLSAVSQNRWPSLKHDVLAGNGLLGPLLSAGFYYKTFMWPKAAWEKLYEPLIRKAAGLGQLDGQPDRGAYVRRHAHCDLLVIGAGPAGLTAALMAARAGAEVILAEEDFELGGELLSRDEATSWLNEVVGELKTASNVTVLPLTCVFGLYDGPTCGALESRADGLQRYWKIYPRRVMIAAGALERPIAFSGNDRPGVMLAGALNAYAQRFAAVPDGPIALFTSTDFGWHVAARLQSKGLEIAAVIDPRSSVDPACLSAVDGEHCLGSVVTATTGRTGLKSIIVTGGDCKTRRFSCRALGVSGGWTPNIALTTHLGHAPLWGNSLKSFGPGRLHSSVDVCGSISGHLATAEVLKDAAEHSRRALQKLGFEGCGEAVPDLPLQDYSGQVPMWFVDDAKGKAFVDFQHDVTVRDMRQAEREGFAASEHAKRYTTLGMATDQGQAGSLNGLAVLADAQQKALRDIGATRARPPCGPVSVGALAGGRTGLAFRPVRHTPSHRWAEAQGAVFTDAGYWKRAQFFPKAGERHWRESVDREVKTVRSSVGFCDVSTLGKIEIFGSDSATFLDWLYINNWRKLPIGKARYGLMLREDGFVLDDGTTSRLGETHFMMTTTTAQAGRVFQHMKFVHQCLFPQLDVAFASATDQWAQFALAGPSAREVLAGLVSQDVSNEALPYLGVRAAEISGIAGWVYRLSFSGELAYELAVPAAYGQSLAEALMRAGRAYDICPYGTEALGVLRIEKGHAAGPELNGQTTAHDLGLGRMMSMKKDYIGRRMAQRAALTGAERPRLVGLTSVDAQQPISAGAHLLRPDGACTADNDLGHVSSAAYSPHLETYIALGFVSNAQNWMERELVAADPVRGRETRVIVTSPHFFDPEGARLHV
ncbi:MAG: sarcosine oxidase subunit alpha family protein [Sphingomonadales bacterium]|nr:sarcosine oxidase subunit alpha family protein [Sphingomonadales bacterium]